MALCGFICSGAEDLDMLEDEPTTLLVSNPFELADDDEQVNLLVAIHFQEFLSQKVK
jgi:hypothetical protein